MHRLCSLVRGFPVGNGNNFRCSDYITGYNIFVAAAVPVLGGSSSSTATAVRTRAGLYEQRQATPSNPCCWKSTVVVQQQKLCIYDTVVLERTHKK